MQGQAPALGEHTGQGAHPAVWLFSRMCTASELHVPGPLHNKSLRPGGKSSSFEGALLSWN